MASSNNFDFPAPPFPTKPPPTPPSARPPLPPIRPPPLPPSPPPPSNNTTVIVIVFVSFGGLLFLAFLAFALCCFIKQKKKKKVQETDLVRVDEHLKVKEAIVGGPHGPQAVVLDIEDDVHVDKVIKKDEKVGEGLRVIPVKGNSSEFDHVEASSPSGSNNHPQLDRKA